MRKGITVVSAAILVALFLSLGMLAQEFKEGPAISIAVPKNFVIDPGNGCITVPAPSSMYAITGGDWMKPEVKKYLTGINPFLLEPRRQFDWNHNGPGSGVYIYTSDRICGFASVKADANLAVTTVSTAHVDELIAERDAALASAAKADTSFVWLFGILAATALAGAIYHRIKMDRRDGFWEKLVVGISTDANKRRDTLIESHKEHVHELVDRFDAVRARAIEETHALYNPYDGEPVVAGGLQPTQPTEIESTMLQTLYGELPIAAHLPYANAVATGLFRRVGPIEYGTMDGHVRVRDAGGKYTAKILRSQPGYRTTVQLPDGTQQTVYSLAACCNPVSTGNWMEEEDDFMFVLVPVGAEISPAPAPPVSTPTPAIQVGELLAELPTPTGGRLLIYGPGPFASDTSANSLTVTVTAPAEKPAAAKPVTPVNTNAA